MFHPHCITRMTPLGNHSLKLRVLDAIDWLRVATSRGFGMALFAAVTALVASNYDPGYRAYLYRRTRWESKLRTVELHM